MRILNRMKLAAALGLACGVTPWPAAAQFQWGPNQTRFVGVKGWTGTYSISLKKAGTSTVQGSPTTYDVNYLVAGTIRAEPIDPSISGLWVSAFNATATINYTIKTQYPGTDCPSSTTVVKGTGSFDTLLDGAPAAKLSFDLMSDTYSFLLEAGDAQVNRVRTWACTRPEPPDSGTIFVPWNVTGNLVGLPFPASGSTLTGQKKMLGWVDLGLGREQMEWDVTWSFDPIIEETEVVVDSTALDEWRPLGALDGSRGNTIDLTARLVEKGKDTPPQAVKAIRWIWEFTAVSREPGVLMNYPRFAEADKKPDLRFEENPAFLVSAEGQRAESLPSEPGTQSVITVGSYDWGGFGVVKVTCELSDGKKIVGYLKGDPQQTEIRLPKRASGSIIADSWKKQNGVAGKPDNADDEEDPIGDGTKGDGLTLYQEYRGFIENGKRVEGNPNKKDFWINCRAGDHFLQGILLFRRLTGLEVHYKLTDTEMEDDRVINRNYDQGPRTTNQHAVWVRVNDGIAGFAIAQGGPGTPGMVTTIYMPIKTEAAYEDSLLGEAQVNYRNTALTHELLHACNVWHHGDAGDYNAVWTRGVGTDNVTEGGQPITVIWEESGENVNYRQPLQREVKIGGFSGTCSGNQACVMRYDDCLAYAPRLSPGIRYRANEQWGNELCSSEQGTGTNLVGRSPQSRYGPAAAGRGACKLQILVNDAVKAPRR